jgi:hypothetical protein
MIKFECLHCGFEMSSFEEGTVICDSCFKTFDVCSDGHTEETLSNQHVERMIKTSDGQCRIALFPKDFLS